MMLKGIQAALDGGDKAVADLQPVERDRPVERLPGRAVFGRGAKQVPC